MDNEKELDREVEKELIAAENQLGVSFKTRNKKPPKQNIQKVVQAILGIELFVKEETIQKNILGKKATANMAKEFKESIVKLTVAELITVKMVGEAANKGRVNAAEWLFNRGFGLLNQKTQLEVNVNHTRYLKDEDLEQALKILEQEAEDIGYEELK